MHVALVAFAVLRFGLRLELGPEFDSNANHAVEAAQSPAGASGSAGSLSQPISSFLLRGTARARLTYSSRPHLFRVTADLGGKWFFADAAAPQDAIAARLSVEERSVVSRNVTLGLAADYHDVLQLHDCPYAISTDTHGNQTFVPDTSCHRDFRLLGARAVAVLGDGIPALGIEAAARSYEWKPDGDLSFQGVGGALTPQARIPIGEPDEDRSLALATAGRIEYRFYTGPRLVTQDDLNESPSSPRRRDLVASWSASVTYTGRLLASAGYLVENDRSTSAGASYLFQAVTLSLSAPLPWKLVAAARAQILFFSTGALPASLAVEDENRNAVSVGLSRELPSGFTLHARYSAFKNASGDGAYLRQLVFAGATWEMR